MKPRDLGVFIYHFSILLALVGALLQWKELMAASTVGVALGYGLRDYFSRRIDSINVMTLYAASAGFWFGLGNLVGYFAEGGPYEEVFYEYEAREFIFQAQVLGTLATIIPPLTYDWAKRGTGRRRILPQLPGIGFDVSDRIILRFTLTLVALSWATQFLGISTSFLGVLDGFVQMGPYMTIFILTYRWLSPDPPILPSWSRWLLIGLMVFSLVNSTMFSNMRDRLAYPIVALCLPFILRKVVTAQRFAIGLLLVFSFILVFKPLGELRGKIFGTARLEQLMVQSPLFASNGSDRGSHLDEWGHMTFLARLSTFNQLSQVVRIADEEGYYEGETLKYLTYVFIPRIIWPEKPPIAPAQWFAEKLGKGTRISETRFSNAINMTIPGELYLNFGWIGVILGLIVLCFLYLLFWESTGFFSKERNPLGQMLAFILLTHALVTGSHVGAIVSLILWYLASLAVSWVSSIFAKRSQAIMSGELD